MNTYSTTIADMRKSITVNDRMLELRHPNAKGTGTALRIRLVTTGKPENRGILVGIANQKTVDGIKSAFDWENPSCVFLDFTETSELLQVLRGETESVHEGKGIYSKSPDGHTLVKFQHLLEPVVGYRLDIYETVDGLQGQKLFVFNYAEALGISEAVGSAIWHIAFGI